MRISANSILLAAILALAPLCGPGLPARAEDAATSAAGGRIAAHVAKIDFGDQWNETVDWDKLDRVTRELAPDRLNWDALCEKVTDKPPADYTKGLSAAEADKFMSALATRIKRIAAEKHVDLTQNEWAIVGCAVVPLQEMTGDGQKYITGLGDTSRLGIAITKIGRNGVNCGDGCVLTISLLKALGIECRFVGCHRKVDIPGQPAGHAMIEYFETNAQGKKFGHIVDATNMSPFVVAGEPYFHPPTSRFQIVGDRLGRLQFLIVNNYLHEQLALQGFDPPFTKEELTSTELADFAAARWETRLDARSVVLDSSPLEATVPEGKSLLYSVMIGKDIPEGAIPIVRMFRKGADGTFHALTSFTLHQRSNSKEVRLVWDILLDGLSPGDYRADFYVNDGTFGFRRGGTYAGEQVIHYGKKEEAKERRLM